MAKDGCDGKIVIAINHAELWKLYSSYTFGLPGRQLPLFVAYDEKLPANNPGFCAVKAVAMHNDSSVPDKLATVRQRLGVGALKTVPLNGGFLLVDDAAGAGR
jgi:hypothetical protein